MKKRNCCSILVESAVKKEEIMREIVKRTKQRKVITSTCRKEKVLMHVFMCVCVGGGGREIWWSNLFQEASEREWSSVLYNTGRCVAESHTWDTGLWQL